MDSMSCQALIFTLCSLISLRTGAKTEEEQTMDGTISKSALFNESTLKRRSFPLPFSKLLSLRDTLSEADFYTVKQRVVHRKAKVISDI